MDAYLNTGDIHAADDEIGSHGISEQEMKKVTGHIDSAFAKAAPTTKPLTVYRGMHLEDTKPGAEWTDKTPVSTSSSKMTGDMYRSWLDADNSPGTGHLVRITVPPGSKALSFPKLLKIPGKGMAQIDQEAEALLPRNSRFRVTGKDPDGTITAELQ
jgi:hypothetical protein